MRTAFVGKVAVRTQEYVMGTACGHVYSMELHFGWNSRCPWYSGVGTRVCNTLRVARVKGGQGLLRSCVY